MVDVPIDDILGKRKESGETLIPMDEIQGKRRRPSDPFKQLVAGVTDIGTGLPSLIGLAGAGIESSFNYLSDLDSDTTFGERFDTALESGVDRGFLDVGLGGRENVNEFLGIENPVSTEDQIARLIGSFAPVPIALPAALGGKIGTTALAITTPFVKKTGKVLSKDFGVRAGAQVGIGIGLDQTIRAVSGHPTLTSTEALLGPAERAGSITLPSGKVIDTVTDDPFGEHRAIDEQLERQSTANTIKAVAAIGAALLGVAAAGRYYRGRQIEKAQPGPSGSVGLAPDQPDLFSVDQVLKQGKKIATTGGPTIKKSKTAATFLFRELVDRKLTGVLRNIRARYIDSHKAVDDALTKSGNLRLGRNAKEGREFEEDFIAQIEEQGRTDPSGQALQFELDGILPKLAGPSVVSLRAIGLRLASMGKTKEERVFFKTLFTDYVTALTVKGTRIRADVADIVRETRGTGRGIKELEDAFDSGASPTELERLIAKHKDTIESIRGKTPRVQPSMYTNRQLGATGKAEPVSLSQLNKMIEVGKNNPLVAELAKDLFENLNGLARLMVYKRILRPDLVDEMRELMLVDSMAAFSPLMEGTIGRLDYDDMLRRLAGMFGIGTEAGREMNALRALRQRSLEGGGVMNPIDPLTAARRYTQLVFEHANRSSHNYNALSLIAGVTVHGSGKGYVISPLTKESDGGVLQRLVSNRDVQDAHLVAVSDSRLRKPGDDFSGVRTITKENAANPFEHELANVPAVREFFRDNNGAEVLRNMYKGQADDVFQDVVVVQRDGLELAFLVTNPLVIGALRNPKLTNKFLKVGGMFKRVFTRFTTGVGSLFALSSAAFQTQTAMITRGLNAPTIGAGFREGFQAIPDTFRGGFAIVKEALARDIAEQITVRLNTNSGFSNLAPDHFGALRDALVRVYEKSAVNAVRRQTGRLNLGLASNVETDVMGALSSALPDVDRMFGANALPMIGRLWQTFNRAANEGTALGITMRRMGKRNRESTPRELRQDIKAGKDAVGDVSIRGSSALARGTAALVPFSGATIQSIRAVGGAIIRNPVKAPLMLATVVGLPTAAEMTWNYVMSMSGEEFTDDNGRKWTYRDWLWNGINAADRVNNQIFFVPGRAPWEAAIIPVSPEWGFFRSAVIEGMDTLFNASNIGIAGELGENGEHWWAAFSRLFDIPAPPIIAAPLAAVGINFRIGLIDDIQQTDEGPVGRGLTFFKGLPTGRGERITARYGQERYADSVFETNAANALQDLFGSGAALAMAFMEGAAAGQARGGILEGLDRGTDALGAATTETFRYLNPLFGKAIRPKLNDVINKEVIAKKQTLQSLRKQAGLLMNKGLVTAGGVPLRGDFPIPDDPIFNIIAVNAETALQQFDNFEAEIAFHNRQLNVLGNATLDQFDNNRPITFEERTDLLDLHVLEIKKLKAFQSKLFTRFEEDASRFLSDVLRREIRVDLSNLDVRPRVGEGLILRAPRSSDQTLP